MKKIIFIFSYIAILMLLSGIIISCTEQTSTNVPVPSKSSSTTADIPQYGGILRIAKTAFPRNMGYPPAMLGNTELDFAPPCVQTLLRFGDTGQIEPFLASKYEYSNDLKSLTLNLNKGIKFHDGTDFNAEAVRWNLENYMKSNRTELKSVSSVDVIDDYTVRLNLSSFKSSLLNYLCEQAGMIVSLSAIKTYGIDWARDHAVGTGPFKLVSFSQDVSVKYTKFDNYWEKGKPYLDGLEYVLITDPMTTSASLQSGEVQAIGTNVAEVAKTLNKMGYQITTPVRCQILVFDSAHSDSPFADIRVRQAISYAINSKAIVGALSELYTPINQPATPGSQYYNKNVVGYPYDPVKAKELLTAAGYPNGFKTSILYPIGGDTDSRVLAVQGYLGKIGIEAPLNGATIQKILDIRANGWQNGIMDEMADCSIEKEPAVVLELLLSKTAPRYKVVSYPDEYQSKLSAIFAEPKAENRIKLNQELMSLIIDKYCMVTPIYLGGYVQVSSTKVHNYTLGKWTHQWLPADAWLSK